MYATPEEFGELETKYPQFFWMEKRVSLWNICSAHFFLCFSAKLNRIESL